MSSINKPYPKLKRAFDPEEFRNTGHALIDRLADHLEDSQKGKGRVIDYVGPDDEFNFWKDYEIKDPMIFFNDIIDRNINLHHRRYIGHQVAAPAYMSALAGVISDLLNAGMGIYEMGAAGTAIERVVIQEFCGAIGYDVMKADGILTSGGTLANLTALLAARADYRSRHDSPKPYILVSDQAHFCIERAAMTMGMSPDQVIKIRTKEDYSVDINVLKKTVLDFIDNGGAIMTIIGCACSTATGSYDDLSAIADICAQYDIWMHVDGAHGGAAIFSHKYRSLCNGMNRADSVIIDAHKMMLTPALATAILFKRESDSYKSLAVEAVYLFERKDAEWHNLAKRTYETTKLMMSIKIFLLMRHYGLELVDEFVTKQYDLTRQFAQIIEEDDNFELGHQPMSNILCFRYVSIGGDLNQINQNLRKRVLGVGKFYIVQTLLRGKIFLRVTIMNPLTNLKDLKDLLEEILIFGKEI